MCGATNPIGNAYCDSCNARIIPMRSEDAEEQPTASEQQQPIQGLTLPSIEVGDEEAEAAEEEESVEEAVEGDWLNQLRSSTEDETQAPEEESEDWLAELRGAAEEEGPAEPIEPAAPQKATEPEPVELPEWMTSEEPLDEAEEETLAEEDLSWEEAFQQPSEAEEPTEAPAEAPEAFSTEPTIEEEPGEMPNWLQSLGMEEEAEEPEAAEETRDKAPFAAPPEEAPAPEEPAPEDETPDWLRSLGMEEEAAKSAPLEAPEPPEAEPAPAPEEPQPSGEPPLTPEAAPTPEDEGKETPDWLRSMEMEEEAAKPAPFEAPEPPEAEPGPAPEEPEATAEEEPTPAMEEEETPDWLRGLEAEETAGAPAEPEAQEGPIFDEEEAPAEPTPEPAEIPDWLQGLAPEEEGAPEAEIEGEELPDEIEQMPAWLDGLGDEEAPTEAPKEAPSPFTAEPPPAPEAPSEAPERPAAALTEPLGEEPTEKPEWLSGLEEEAQTSAFEQAGVPPEEAGLARADIPGWLQAMRPTGEGAEPGEREAVETEGLLEGLRGVLSPAPITETIPVGEKPSMEIDAEATRARAQLLQGLLTRRKEAPEVEPQQETMPLMEHVVRVVVTLILLATVVGALLVPQFPTLSQPASSIGAERLDQSLGALAPGDQVMVVFAYGTAEADELDVIAEPLLRRLNEQEVQLLAVTTHPEGAALAARLLGALSPSLQAPVTYRAGGASAVAQILGQQDPAAILVLAAKAPTLRWWIEQTQAIAPDVPLMAGTSAALEPLLRPYTEDVYPFRGFISGLRGLAAYQALQDGATPGPRFNALAAGHLVIAGLLVLGMLIYAVAGRPERKRDL